MGCASSDEEYPVDFEEEEHQAPPVVAQNPPTIPSAHASAFNLVEPQHASIHPNMPTFANRCCEEFGLADAFKEDVLRTAKLPPQFLLVRLYARTVAFGKHVQTTKVDSFLTSSEFRETITRRLQAGLLDPQILNYVEGTTARCVRHIVENPASYDIPPAVQAQFMHSKVFSSAVGKVLSAFRGEIQRKIQRSVIDQDDITTLATKLAIRGFQLTQDHLFRFAFLRMYYIDFKESDKSNDDKTMTKFWLFIDKKLKKLRKKSPAEILSALQRNFNKDKRKFPPPKAGAPELTVTHLPEWQASVGHAIATMSGYRAASAPADEAQGTDGDIESNEPTRIGSTFEPPLEIGPNGPTQHRDIEQGGDPAGSDEEAPGGGPVAQQPPYMRPTESMEVDDHSRLANQAPPYPPVNYSMSSGTGPSARHRLGTQTLSTRGSNVRHNPLGTPSRSSTSSPTPTHTQHANPSRPRPRLTANSQVITGAYGGSPIASPMFAGPPYRAESSQYDPHGSETADATVGHT